MRPTPLTLIAEELAALRRHLETDASARQQRDRALASQLAELRENQRRIMAALGVSPAAAPTVLPLPASVVVVCAESELFERVAA